MAECCDPVPYRRFFNTKEATRRLAQFRRRGLDDRASAIVDFLDDAVGGATVLEVGGGIGELHLELLERGARVALNVELSDAYEPIAATLAHERGVDDRVEWRIGDFTDIHEELEPADIVVLNRVVCCYPFMERMVRAAAGRTAGHLGLVYPRDRWWNRTAVTVGNAWTRLRRCGFEGFVHPVDAIHAVAGDGGLVLVHRSNDLVWESAVWARAT